MLVGGAAEKEHAKKNEFEAKIGFRFGHLVLVTVGPRLLVLFGVSLEKKRPCAGAGGYKKWGGSWAAGGRMARRLTASCRKSSRRDVGPVAPSSVTSRMRWKWSAHSRCSSFWNWRP